MTMYIVPLAQSSSLRGPSQPRARPKYLEKTLGSIMLHYPDQGGPDVFISQDGNNLPVQNVISKFKLKFKENHGGDVTHLKHVQAGGAARFFFAAMISCRF